MSKIIPAILCAATAVGAVAVTAGEASAQPGYYRHHYGYRSYYRPAYRPYGYGYRHHYRPYGYYGRRHHRW